MLQLYLPKHSYQSKYFNFGTGQKTSLKPFSRFVFFLNINHFSYIRNPFLAVLLLFNKKIDTIRVAAVYQRKKNRGKRVSALMKRN